MIYNIQCILIDIIYKRMICQETLLMKTPEELCKEILENTDIKAEFIGTLSDPALTSAFLKKYDCDAAVNDFIALLDKYNG